MAEARSVAKKPAAASPLVYPVQPPAPDGSLVEVADGVLWARMPMPMALDHVNVYLLRGERGWTVVDTGLNTGTTRDLWERIATTLPGGLPIEALVCTHWHYDHAGQAAWFGERFGVPLYMTHGEYYVMQAHAAPAPQPIPPQRLQFYERSGMPAERIGRMFERLRQDAFVAPAPPVFRRLRAGSELAIGDRRWRVVIGEGHSPEHACLYDASGPVLLAGDQLLPRISSNVMVTDREPEADPLALWLDSLARLDRLAPDTLVLPSHGGVFRGLRFRTRELRAHHERQLGILRTQVREHGPCSAFEAILVLFPRLRGPMDDVLALGETIAHLAWLCRAGEFTRTLDDAGVYRFGLAPRDTPEPAA